MHTRFYDDSKEIKRNIEEKQHKHYQFLQLKLHTPKVINGSIPYITVVFHIRSDGKINRYSIRSEEWNLLELMNATFLLQEL